MFLSPGCRNQSSVGSDVRATLEHPVELRLIGGGRVPVLVGLWLGHVSSPPGRRQVLEHGGVVGGEHVLQVRWHRVGPKEVVVERVIAVSPLGRIQNQELIDEVQSIGVFDVGFEAVLHLPLLALGQLHLLVQLVLLVHAGPDLRGDGPTQLADQGQLVLLCVPLHDGAPGPHLRHDAARPPQVDGGAVVSFT